MKLMSHGGSLQVGLRCQHARVCAHKDTLEHAHLMRPCERFTELVYSGRVAQVMNILLEVPAALSIVDMQDEVRE